MRTPVIAILDVGKTHKKAFLFDLDYQIVHETSTFLPETVDEDGYPCEDLALLRAWVEETLQRLSQDPSFEIRAFHCSAYGASLVYLDETASVIPPLYNYLKPYPKDLLDRFYNTYGGEEVVCKETASPSLGNLNAGMQLYRIKYQAPEKYARIKYALHLPQYLGFLLCGKMASDLTSIGCHTQLWDFTRNHYHRWVLEEQIDKKLAPILPGSHILGYTEKGIPVGVGLHDSSSALIPYMRFIEQPFLLLSTGTWCISLNPFNELPLTLQELRQDCLCYLTPQGRQVKAARFFGGFKHQEGVLRIARHFSVGDTFYTSITPDKNVLNKWLHHYGVTGHKNGKAFSDVDLNVFADCEEAYHVMMVGLVNAQVESTKLIINDTDIRSLYVDGGFCKNALYMHLLVNAYPEYDVYAAEMAQASALGAALFLHDHWNSRQGLSGLVNTKKISPLI